MTRQLTGGLAFFVRKPYTASKPLHFDGGQLSFGVMPQKLACILIALLHVGCDCGEKLTATGNTMQPFTAGQVWTYNARPGEEASRIIICRVEADLKLGQIVHIHVNGVRLKNKHSPGGSSDQIGHMPYSGEVHSSTGLIHVIAASAALLFGLGVFLAHKGTRFHKQLGYGYVFSMVIMNLTAFLIYRLFHRFGPFHVAAVISSATLAAGFIPVFLRRPRDRWLPLHYEFMAWSYVGLLSAAAAEIAVRLPKAPFWGGVLGSSIAVFVLGAIMISRARSRFIR